MKLKVTLTNIDVQNATRYAKESLSMWIMYFPSLIQPKASKVLTRTYHGCIVIKQGSKYSVHPAILKRPKKKTKYVVYTLKG